MSFKHFPKTRIVRILLIILAVCAISLGIVYEGTSRLSSKSPDDNFQKFTSALFSQEVSTNTITLHYTLKDPEKYGIQNTPVTFGSYTYDTASSSAAIENCLAALKKHDYDKLSEKNKMTYDVLDQYLTLSLEGSEYALYDEPLSPLTGIQSQMPVLLSEYQFHNKQDIETYLTLLEETPAYFTSLESLEQTKSKAGLFMASYTADSIIKECTSFIDMGENNYLYSSFEQRIESMEELTQEEKDTYTAKNKEQLKNHVFPAYQQLIDTLNALRTSGKNNNGLCYYPKGTSYYEYVVKRETGSSRSITALQELTRRQMTEDLLAMQEILNKQKSSSEETKETASLTLEDSNPSAILNELKNKLPGDFPAPPEVSTTVKYVQKEMEEFLSPAFYMVPALDNTQNNVIYINQGHLPDDLELYTTLAHEGYPGHLYQTVYYANQNPDPIRNILNFGGYTEGWATYSEMLSYYYSPLDKDQAILMQRNSSVILGLYALADMGIHYDGWTLVDAVSFFREYGITDNNTIENIYDLIVADPANYLKYYIGYAEILDLKKEAVKAWGDSFTQERFHKAVLDAGPSSFDILKDHIIN